MEATQQEQIGQRIRARRKVCGMTQTALGDAVGLNKSTIQRYESGKIDTIKLPVLAAIAQTLNVSAAWLTGQSPHAEPEAAPTLNWNDFDNLRPIGTKRSVKSPAENLFLHRKNENSL